MKTPQEFIHDVSETDCFPVVRFLKALVTVFLKFFNIFKIFAEILVRTLVKVF